MADLHRRDRSVPTRMRTGCRRAAGADLLHMLSAEPVTFSPSKLAEAAGALRRPTKRARTKLTRSCLPWRHSLQRAPATTLRAQLHGYTTKLAGVGVARFQGAFTLPVPGVNYENVQLAGDHFGRPRWAAVGRAGSWPDRSAPAVLASARETHRADSTAPHFPGRGPETSELRATRRLRLRKTRGRWIQPA